MRPLKFKWMVKKFTINCEVKKNQSFNTVYGITNFLNIYTPINYYII